MTTPAPMTTDPTGAVRPTDPTSAIEVRDVSFRYAPDRAALDGVTLRVAAGSLTALLGPNGSGKSTLIRLLAQLGTPASGSITIGGGARQDVRSLLGVVFQSPALDPRLTVHENLACAARLQGLGRDETEQRIRILVTRLELADRLDARVQSLSLGLARRVDLCRALIHQPRVLLLDEPTAGLDPAARERFIELIDSIRSEGAATVLMTTHLVDEADRADRVVLMHRGRIVADGDPGTLRRRLGPRIVVVNGAEPPPGVPANADRATNAEHALTWQRRHGAWIAELENETQAASCAVALLAQERSFSMAPPSLADLFAHLTGDVLETSSEETAPDDHAAGRTRT